MVKARDIETPKEENVTTLGKPRETLTPRKRTTPCRSPEDQPTPAGSTQLSSPANAEQSTAVTPKTTIAPKIAARPQRVRRPPQYLKNCALTD